MKTHLYIKNILLATTVALGLSACEDFLTEKPYGQLTSEGFFSSKEDLDASLNALYSVVATSQGQNNYCGTNFLAGDDISTHPASNKQPLREHDQFSVTDNNSWLVSMWEQRYKVIKAANFIINNAERTPDVSTEDIKRALAQAHYWRAYSYFYLVTTWGKVPVMLEEEIDYNASLKSVEEVYELILSDLKIAEEGCPAMYSSEPYATEALRTGVIWAAGLDVFEHGNYPIPELTCLDNVVMTPHTGTQTVEIRHEMAAHVSRNIINFFEGGPIDKVNLI